MGAIAITFAHVAKRFGSGPPVLNDVSRTIETGHFVVVAGSSGSGKTVRLRMINGFTEPTAGHVLIGGIGVKAMREANSRVGDGQSPRSVARWLDDRLAGAHVANARSKP